MSEWLRTEYEKAYSLIRAAEFWRRMARGARSVHEKQLAQTVLKTVEAELRELPAEAYYPAHVSYMAQLEAQLATNSIGARQTHSANPPRGTMRMLRNGWLRWQAGKLERFDLERAS